MDGRSALMRHRSKDEWFHPVQLGKVGRRSDQIEGPYTTSSPPGWPLRAVDHISRRLLTRRAGCIV